MSGKCSEFPDFSHCITYTYITYTAPVYILSGIVKILNQIRVSTFLQFTHKI